MGPTHQEQGCSRASSGRRCRQGGGSCPVIGSRTVIRVPNLSSRTGSSHRAALCSAVRALQSASLGGGVTRIGGNVAQQRGWCQAGWLLVSALAGVLACSAEARGQQAPDIPQPPSALAPENVAKARPAAPFNLTGNWFIENTPPVQGWLFGPAAIPKLTPEAQKYRDAYVKAAAEGKVYRDDIGQCWPAGVPIIMTRVWPIAMIQVPTAVYMISGFMNS